MSALKGINLFKQKPFILLPFPIAVGQVTKSIDGNTRQVKVIKMVLNDYLKMYFNKSYVFDSVDSAGESNNGDIVLIRRFSKPPTQTKLYNIEKILFKIDDIVDPITGMKISHDDEILQKHIEILSKAFSGENEQSIN